MTCANLDYRQAAAGTQFDEGRAYCPIPGSFVRSIRGGHVRVGLEDTVDYEAGELAESNAQRVERVARIAEAVGRPVATPERARSILNL